MKNGNINWDKDEEVIFHSSMLRGEMNSKDSSEEILYNYLN